jgi:hypothetical protein
MVRVSGFEVIYIDEIDISRNVTYIVTGPEVRLLWKQDKARIIFWLLEWYGDYYQRSGVSETWVSNRTFAGMIDAKFVPMGSRAELGTVDKMPPVFDFIHLSYDGIYRRRAVLDRCEEVGLRIAPNGWGDVRHRNLRSSRAMVHIHQHDDFPGIAPLRASIAASYGLPLIAENGWSTEPYDYGMLVVDYGKMPDNLPDLIQLAEDTESGKDLHQLLCDELRFDKVVLANV